jgi:hypothetical protein
MAGHTPPWLGVQLPQFARGSAETRAHGRIGFHALANQMLVGGGSVYMGF